MSKNNAAECGTEIWAFEVYTAALNLLPDDYDERHNIATIVMHLARYGDNVKLIAQHMRRSEGFVRERIEVARHIFDPA